MGALGAFRELRCLRCRDRSRPREGYGPACGVFGPGALPAKPTESLEDPDAQPAHGRQGEMESGAPNSPL